MTHQGKKFSLPYEILYNMLNFFLQKAIKEKEFELLTIKNQKLENLCRALQEERKSLYAKVHGAGSQPEDKSADPSEKGGSEKTPEDPNENQPIQNTGAAAPTGTPTLTSPLTEEMAKLKAEQALLKEVASSFTISHIASTETGTSQSHEPTKEPEENHIEQSEHQEVHEDGYQQQRDLEMESVD